MKGLILALMLCVPASGTAVAQAAGEALPDLAGTWEVSTPDGMQRIVVRADSSASFNKEIVRWLTYDGKLYIAFGDEWVGYNFELKGRQLTLSGGDLEEPVILERIGPPTARPAGIDVPPAPPFKPQYR